jgi:hypothetical protein
MLAMAKLEDATMCICISINLQPLSQFVRIESTRVFARNNNVIRTVASTSWIFLGLTTLTLTLLLFQRCHPILEDILTGGRGTRCFVRSGQT